jgi:hypothetical protein
MTRNLLVSTGRPDSTVVPCGLRLHGVAGHGGRVTMTGCGSSARPAAAPELRLLTGDDLKSAV